MNTVLESTNRWILDQPSEIRRRDINHQLMRGKGLSVNISWLPQRLCAKNNLEFLTEREQLVLNHIQARSYVRIQLACEEINGAIGTTEHQYLFRQFDATTRELIPDFQLRKLEQIASDFKESVTLADHWSRSMFALHQSHTVQAHYKLSLKKSYPYASLFKDLFFYHWKEKAKPTKQLQAIVTPDPSRPWKPVSQQSFQAFKKLMSQFKSWLTQLAKAETDFFLQFRKPSLTSNQTQTLTNTCLKGTLFRHLQSPLSGTSFKQCLNSQISRKQWLSLAPLFPLNQTFPNLKAPTRSLEPRS